MSCPLPSVKVNEAFLAAPPMIAQQIADLTVKHPSFLRDVMEYEQWPVAAGNIMEQLVYRGAMPKIERGFDKWKGHPNNTGCAPCSGPNCAYNWTQFGGHGFERKVIELMSRDFRSPEYCVKEIQTTAHFKDVFGKIVENLYRQVDYFKEFNISHNFLTMLAKKFVVDSTGARINTADPYNYPGIGNARLSMLNVQMLEFFYEGLRRMPDAVPYDVIDGSPIFALMCSHQLLSRLYRDDPNSRQDVRFSGLANDMLMKYNFMSSIRGMFLPAPILYPRRFKIVAGTPVEVLPFLDDIPMEVGAFTGNNPAYENETTHEEVLILSKYPAKVFYQNTEQTLGENSSFGPEFGYFDSWKWVNPETIEDPARRVGFYFTNATIGLAPQFSEGLLAILVERPSRTQMAAFFPNTDCPPVPAVCDNAIPATGCPCPNILSVVANPITAGRYFFTFSTAVEGSAESAVVLGLSTGGYVVGTIVAISEDGLTAEIAISGDVTDCTKFTSVVCEDARKCTTEVLAVSDCGSAVVLTLRNSIKAGVGQDITVVYSDGTTATVTLTAVDLLTNQYTTDPTPADSRIVGGIVQVCVPATTDASCAGCGGLVLEACES